ncbi:MAG TPA: hypothetical protein PLC53_01875 [Bacilli bacterium]|nr:hypothetical protein [Bacilli bacterium]
MAELRYNYNNFIDSKNNAIKANSVMTDIIDSKSSIVSSIPSDFERYSYTKQVIDNITSICIKGNSIISTYTEWENEFLEDGETSEYLDSDTDSRIIRDAEGNIIGILTTSVYISLDSFTKIESDNGTYYSWNGEDGSGLTTPCDIYIPKVKEITGVTIYFTGFKQYYQNSNVIKDDNIESIKEGNIDTDSIIMIPIKCYSITNSGKTFNRLSQSVSDSIVTDAQSIATAFGTDSSNLSVYGFSAGGELAGSLVTNSEDGTFKTAVFASATFPIGYIDDPDIKIISLVGEREETLYTYNYERVCERIESYEKYHDNEVEFYVVSNQEGDPLVSHGELTAAAAKSTMFDGEGIFKYISDLY